MPSLASNKCCFLKHGASLLVSRPAMLSGCFKKPHFQSTHRRAGENRKCFTLIRATAGYIEEEQPSLEEIKVGLLDSLYDTERGLTASSETRAEINELITQLEAMSPISNPNEAVEKLNGSWRLVYTANSELMPLLSLAKLPFVSVGDITQRIESSSLSVENQVQLTVPFSRTALSTMASFDVRSPKRLQLVFETGRVSTPELLQDIELPSTISVLGQSVDLTNLKDALQPASSSLRDAFSQIASFVSSQPDLQFPIRSERAQTWLINTYLDDDTRISRGDGGSIFILVKDAPPASTRTSDLYVYEETTLSEEPLINISPDIESLA